MAGADERLKLLIDTKIPRVLFGEAEKKVIDFLFNLLSLPLGTVIRLLKKQSMVGCLGNVYESVETLSETYLQPNLNKDTLLKPKVSFRSSTMLLPHIESPAASPASYSFNFFNSAASSPSFYLCNSDASPTFGSSSSSSFSASPFPGSSFSASPFSLGNSSRSRGTCSYYVSDGPNATCPSCKRNMSQIGKYVQPPRASTQPTVVEDEGGFVKGVVTYMVMDDLTVKPMSAISSITLLNKFNVKELASLEEKVVTLGVNEGLKLLKASLQSNTVLTDVFL